MPFADFFGEQLRDLENFLAISTGNVRVVRVDPEMRGLLLRMLGKRRRGAGFPAPPHWLLRRFRRHGVLVRGT